MKMSKRALKNFKKIKADQKAMKESSCTSTYISYDLESRPLEEDLHEPKGMPGGRCNVTACQAPGAIFLNVGMLRGNHPDNGGCYYCAHCATDIHESNLRFKDDFTLFPAFNQVMARYNALRRVKSDRTGEMSFLDSIDLAHDINNYQDINQNPWGGAHHSQRDAYLEKQNEQV